MKSKNSIPFFITLISVTAAGPVAMQLYIPSVPAITKDFEVSLGVAQFAFSLSLITIFSFLNSSICYLINKFRLLYFLDNLITALINRLKFFCLVRRPTAIKQSLSISSIDKSFLNGVTRATPVPLNWLIFIALDHL